MPQSSAWPGDPPEYRNANINQDPDTTRTPSQSISDHPDFHSLRHAQRRFGLRATVWSVGGFLLYVLLSSFAPGMLNQPLFGHLTLGLALGLGQFAVMAATAWRYTVHMRTRVDPLARGLRSQLRQRENLQSRTAGQPRSPWQPVRRETRGYRTW